MAILRGRRRRATRYYVRHVDGRTELARVTSRGSSARYEPATGAWVNDPLLAVTIRISDEWTAAATGDLPPGLRPAARPVEDGTRRRHRGGRHATPHGSS
ncbi:MAG: hypothetical protein JWR55_1108 [Aeromicrobium sp.]|jgi:hypothetical protein|nr:hypothetical protein [Aeromicrobium sp.]